MRVSASLTYVVQVSSLYPIDLSAALYVRLLHPQSTIRVFLSDVADLPSNPEVRHLTARAALPLLEWSVDKSGVFRQHHVPLEGMALSELEECLLRVARTFVTDGRDETGIMFRAKSLADSAKKRMHESRVSWKSSWAAFSAGIIEEIFSSVDGGAISIEPYWPFRNGNFEGHPEYREASAQAWDRLLFEASKVFPRRLHFLRGGKVEIRTNALRNQWHGYSNICSDGQYIVLGQQNQGNCTTELELHRSQVIAQRYRGPMEILQLQELGVLVDFPWYAEGIIHKNWSSGVRGLEVISPVSVSSHRRVSANSGGEGMRLCPSGYSLIDFDSPAVFDLLGKLLGIDGFKSSDLDDWKFLVDNYPVTSQKLSKHQGSIRAFRDLREAHKRRVLAAGEVFGFESLIQTIDQISPLLYGNYLLSLLSLVTMLKEWISPRCPYPVPGSILLFLETLGWVDKNGVLKVAPLAHEVSLVHSIVERWIMSHDGKQENMSGEFIEKGVMVLERSDSRSLIDRTNGHSMGLGLIAKGFRSLADSYYSYASFFCGALFKAHILFPYLLFGPEVYKEQIINLLKLREDNACLYFDTVLWETMGAGDSRLTQ